MKLFLTSSTITPNLIQPFEEFVGKSSKGLKCAFIPDAGYGSTPDDTKWIDEEREELARDLDWDVTQVALRDESYESLQKLADFDVIYVNGGFSGYLAKEMRRTGFDRLLPELLAQGVVYVGSSAGSMVMSKTQDGESWYIGEPEPEAKTIPGLGLIDFEIYPMHDHFYTPELVPQIMERRDPAIKFFLLRDGQAISVEDGKVVVHGDGVIFLDANKG